MSRKSSLDFPEIDRLIDDATPRKSSSLTEISGDSRRPKVHRLSVQTQILCGPEENLQLPEDSRLQLRRKSSGGSRQRSSLVSQRTQRKSTSSAKKFLSDEERALETKRKRMVRIVVGMFLFILLSCVFVVIVTLTHQSEKTVDGANETRYHYTFAPNSERVAESTTRAA